MRRILVALAATAVALVPSAAHAADTLDFWNGVSTSGQCGAATFLGSQKIDDPFTSGLQQAGTIQKYKRTCSYPTVNQTCWYTQASLISGGVVRAGIGWRSEGGVNYSSYDSGYGTITSPVICAHQVDGSSWWAWAAVGSTNATLYT